MPNIVSSCAEEPRLTANPLARSPRCYSHFILAQTKASVVISLQKLQEPLNLVCGALMTRLTGFHCNAIAAATIPFV